MSTGHTPNKLDCTEFGKQDVKYLCKKAMTPWMLEEEDFVDAIAEGRPIPASTTHFTQAVWSTSTQVGCGAASAPHADANVGVVYMLACFYVAKGNIHGPDFAEHVKPRDPIQPIPPHQPQLPPPPPPSQAPGVESGEMGVKSSGLGACFGLFKRSKQSTRPAEVSSYRLDVAPDGSRLERSILVVGKRKETITTTTASDGAAVRGWKVESLSKGGWARVKTVDERFLADGTRLEVTVTAVDGGTRTVTRALLPDRSRSTVILTEPKDVRKRLQVYTAVRWVKPDHTTVLDYSDYSYQREVYRKLKKTATGVLAKETDN